MVANEGEPFDLNLVEPALVASRSVLCRALDALAEQRDALTVIGAHAGRGTLTT